MGPRYTKAIILLVVGSPVLAAGIIIENSLESHSAQSSTITIARLMIAVGACMVAIGIFLCCMIMSTNKKEEPNPRQPSADGVQISRLRITSAPYTQPHQRGVQLVTYSPISETQNAPNRSTSCFYRNQVVNSNNAVQYRKPPVVANNQSIHGNCQNNTPDAVDDAQHTSIPNSDVVQQNITSNHHRPPPRISEARSKLSNISGSNSQLSNASDANSQRSNLLETKSQHSNVSDKKSQRSNISEHKSQRSSASEHKSQRSNTSEPKSHRSNNSEHKSQRSNNSEHKSQRSNNSEHKNQRSNISEHKNQRANISEHNCQRPNVHEMKNQISNISEVRSQTSNTSDTKSQQSSSSEGKRIRSETKRQAPKITEARNQRSSSAESKNQTSNTPGTKYQRSRTPETKPQLPCPHKTKNHCSNTPEAKSPSSDIPGTHSNTPGHKSQCSTTPDGKSQCSNAPEIKNKRPNVLENKKQRSVVYESKNKHSNPSVTQGHRANPTEIRNSDHPIGAALTPKVTHPPNISSQDLIYPVSATDMAKLLVAAKRVMDPSTFEDIAQTYSIVYSPSVGPPGELGLGDPLMTSHVASNASSSPGPLEHIANRTTYQIHQPNDHNIDNDATLPLHNVPSAPPYQEPSPEFDPPPYSP